MSSGLPRALGELRRKVARLERREGLLAASFVDTAAGAGDVLRVVAPGWDDGEQPLGDPHGVVWAPRTGDDGDPVYPIAGDPAYVQEASDGSWVVVGWRPA